MSVLNAAVGLTVRSQTALGRIEWPSSASNPASPANFQSWFRTDLGVGGRLHFRHSDGQNVPYLPLRQEVLGSSAIAASTSSTSYADIVNATVSITPTGGVLEIDVVGTDAGNFYLLIVGGASSSYGIIRAVAGSTNLGPSNVGVVGSGVSSYARIPVWRVKPTAGVAITVKLQWLVAHNTSSIEAYGTLRVREYGDAAA